MTPDEARRLLDGTTPGPWCARDEEWIADCPDSVEVITGTDPYANPYGLVAEVSSSDDYDIDPEMMANARLIAAAPTLAALAAGMREEWGVAVTYPGLAEVVEWGFCTRDGAEAEGNAIDTEYRIVRRYVTEPEEIK